MTRQALDANGNSIDNAMRIGTTRSVSIGASASSTPVLSTNVKAIRIMADTDCFVRQGGNATTNDMPLVANQAERFRCDEIADFVSVIGTTGTLYVTELL